MTPTDQPESGPHWQRIAHELLSHMPIEDDRNLAKSMADEHALADLARNYLGPCISALQRADEQMRNVAARLGELLQERDKRIAELENAIVQRRWIKTPELAAAEASIAELERIGHDCTLEWNAELTAAEARAEAAERERDLSRELFDELTIKHNLALGDLAQAERERDAYMHAKAENDERFMLERDTLRAENERLRAALERIASDPEIMCKSCANIAREALKTKA